MPKGVYAFHNFFTTDMNNLFNDQTHIYIKQFIENEQKNLRMGVTDLKDGDSTTT